MRRSLQSAALLLLVLATSACLTGGRRGGDAAMTAYDLGLPVMRAEAGGAAGTRWQLEVKAPVWLDSAAMVYRLAYADPAQWREFSQARWVAPPAGLLERRLQRLLGYAPAGRRGACLLRLELDEFSQVFTDPQRSHALLSLQASWFDGERKPLLVKPVRIELAAGTDAQSGVAALVQAVGSLGEQLAATEKTLSASCR